MKKILLTPFIILASIGLVLSVTVHLCALLGINIPFAKEAWGLHGGIFIVWLPAVIVAQRLSKDFKQKDLWKAALRGCPTWMQYITYFFFGYAILNFALFMLGATASHAGKNELNELRGFSGHWMAFYSAAMAILYSATHYENFDETRKCLNGHSVSPLAKFCEECGAPVIGQSNK